MKNKISALLLFAAMMLGALLTLAACGEDEDPSHIHVKASEWSFDDFGHWHAYTCCPDASPSVEPHTGYGDDGICDGCLQHVHTHGTELDYDDDGHWYKATCEHTDHKIKYAEHDGMRDKICNTCGFEDKSSGGPIKLPIIGA